MAKREELTKGVFVQLNCDYENSHKQSWRNPALLKGSYATFVQYHREVREAVKISYKYRGGTEFSHVHYLDLDVVDEIPEIKKEAVTFDTNNLDL